MSEKHGCSGTAYSPDRFSRPMRCSRNGSIERDGKWYCKTHDPVAIAERDRLAREKSKAALEAHRKASALRAAAPALYEALKHVKAHASGLSPDEWEVIDAALSAASPKENGNG